MAGCERILEYLGRGHGHRRLDNHKAIHGYWANLADWVSLSRYPRAQRAGLKNQAVAYSMDSVSRRSTAEVLRGITGGTFADFDDAATARRALLSS